MHSDRNLAKKSWRTIFNDYLETFDAWTAIDARFPLGWPSPDKKEHQMTLDGIFLFPALDLEDNRDLRGIPLDLELRQCLARPVSPGLKFREGLCRMRIFGPLFSLDSVNELAFWGRSFSVTCLQPLPNINLQHGVAGFEIITSCVFAQV